MRKSDSNKHTAPPLTIEILDLSDPSITVVFHKGLNRNYAISPKLRTVLAINPEAIFALFPPVFYQHDKYKYSLVARYWVYSLYLIEDGFKINKSIPAVIVHDQQQLGIIQKYDQIDKQWLNKMNQSKQPGGKAVEKATKIISRPRSRKTKSIAKSLSTARICPFSDERGTHALSTPRSTSQPDKSGLIHTQCIDRSRGCNFIGRFTAYELQCLKQYKYPTESWLTKTEWTCPKCNKHPLYIRTLRRDASGPAEVFSVCRNYFDRVDYCDYMVPLKK
jgi:hypothetical protein